MAADVAGICRGLIIVQFNNIITHILNSIMRRFKDFEVIIIMIVLQLESSNFPNEKKRWL